MATTTSHGLQKPQTGDTGATFWTDLANAIQVLNDHTHNGTNSELLTAASSLAVTQTVSSGSWGADLGGSKYRQLVTLPGTLIFEGSVIQVRLSTGEMVYPTIEKVSSTTYYIYSNDNSKTFTVYYST